MSNFPINKRVEWESSDETIAKVSPNGIVRGLKQGIATITVKTCDGGKTAKCKVTVKPPSISVTPAYVTLYVDDTTTLDVEPTPSYYGYSSVKWSRSFSLFPAAKVDSNGKVTALREGTSVITATTNDGRKSTCTVKVVKKIEVTSIKVSPTSYTLFEGETVRLSYWVKPSDATNPSLKWSSSDPSIATVDSNGLIKGVKGGTYDKPCTVTITATAQDGSGKKATCKVTVYKRIWFATKKTQIVDIDYGEGITVKGVIKSFYNLKSVTVGFISIDTETKKETNYWSKEYSVNSNSFDLNQIDKDVSFSTLPEGSYKFVVKATDIYGYEKTLQSTSFKVKEIIVRFSDDADSSVVSSYSISVIKDAMRTAGVKYCTITSTIRTPKEQAEAMYNNCNKKNGVQEQLKLYGDAGDQVINVYIKNHGKKSPNEIKKLMTEKIEYILNVEKINVSRHCVSLDKYAERNVIDIGYAAIVEQGKNNAFSSSLSSSITHAN